MLCCWLPSEACQVCGLALILQHSTFSCWKLCLQSSELLGKVIKEALILDIAPLQSGEKQGKVQKLSKNEVLMLNIGSMCTGARVIAVSFCSPSSLVCAVSAA